MTWYPRGIMAQDFGAHRPVRRRTISGSTPEIVQQRRYDNMLESEIGPRAVNSFVNQGDAHTSRLGDLLARPLAFLLLCFVAFCIILAVLLWRDGRFGKLWEARGAIVDMADKSWLMGGKDAARVSDDPASNAVSATSKDKPTAETVETAVIDALRDDGDTDADRAAPNDQP
jgi:hypothetical protein